MSNGQILLIVIQTTRAKTIIWMMRVRLMFTL